jgi:hypothetical protein
MINNAEYLIQKFAESRENMNTAADKAGRNYWKGAMDTHHSLLIMGFNDWAKNGTTGYYVFYEGMTYDEAITAAGKCREEFDRDQSNYHAERDPEEKYWAAVATYNERHTYNDDDYDY